MKGVYIRRKLKKAREKTEKFIYDARRYLVKLLVRNKDFSIISNNCWAGRVYQYLDMPYLSPTAGLYFFAPDYIKFIKDLKGYLDTPLEFVEPTESKYYDELKKRNQLDKPIGRLKDIEIVFLHYPTKEEAAEKWNRRKERVNFDNLIFKFSRMNLCTDKEISEYISLPFRKKVLIDTDTNKNRKLFYFSYNLIDAANNQVLNDSSPLTDATKLIKLINKK